MFRKFKLSSAIILIALLTAFHQHAFAQSTGYRRADISYNVMNINWESGNGQPKAKGISADFTKGQPIGHGNFLVEYGGRVSWSHAVSKYTDKFTNETMRSTFLNVSLPVCAIYQFNLRKPGLAITPFLGPNFKFNVIANYKDVIRGNGMSLVSKNKTNYLNREEQHPANIFQFGLNMGVGVTFNKFHVRYTFQPDLTKFIDSGWSFSGEAPNCKTRVGLLSIGIIF